MPLAGRPHVVVAVEPQLHGAARLACKDCRDAGEKRHLRFLAAEASSHAAAFDDDVMVGDTERAAHHVLHLARMLRRDEDPHSVALLRNRERDLSLEVEVILSAAREAAAAAMRRRGDRVGGMAACDVHGRQHVRLRRQRIVDRKQCRQRRNDDVRQCCRPACSIDARGRDREHRLPGELDDTFSEDRIVALDRSDVVDTRYVGRRDQCDDTRRIADGVERQSFDRSVRRAH